MKVKIYFRLNFISPLLEISSEEDAGQIVRLWCATKLKMPLEMIKAITIEKVEVNDE